jgi:hypothetical protein
MKPVFSIILIMAGLGMIGTVVGSPVGALCLILGVLNLASCK